MLEINLLPEEFKFKKDKTSELKQYLPHLIFVFIGILIFLHLYLVMMTTSQNLRFEALNKRWVTLEPERKKIANLKNQSELSSQERGILEELTAKSIVWSRILNKLSLNLVSGIWFNEISISQKGLVIKATALSLKKNEIDLINKFISNLKNEPVFIKEFNNLDLGVMQRKNMGSMEVVDFTLTASLKSK